MPNKKNHFDQLKKSLEKKRQQIVDEFQDKHADAVEWLEDKGADFETVKTVAKRGAAVSAISGLLLASPTSLHHKPIDNVPITASRDLDASVNIADIEKEATRTGEILDLMFKHLPKEMRTLKKDEQETLTSELSNALGFKVTANLEGTELNTNYGKIGQEQHLRRWEGDTLEAHTNPETGTSLLKYGMAPGKGAWGYFGAKNSVAATETEKWYVVGQTWLWPSSQPDKIKWLKHKKMVVVNVETGKVVVGAMGDAGPATWTGKVFGGSPRVMTEIGAVDKSKVLMFFVDDPEGKVPLGSVVK